MSENTVVGVQAQGAMRSGICVHGPLIGKRVVSMSNGPWMPAGQATKDEMLQANGSAFNDFWAQAFGAAKGTP